jgi:hypothetical protein
MKTTFIALLRFSGQITKATRIVTETALERFLFPHAQLKRLARFRVACSAQGLGIDPQSLRYTEIKTALTT